MDPEWAVSAVGLGKCYRLYDNPKDKLKEVLSFGRRTYHREFWALRDISMQIRKGETLGIVGRNGSGKSTLLQILCGTLAPSLGEVQISGRVAALLELGAGFNPEFTGRENVFMNGTILGLSREEVAERYEAISAFADIGQFMDQPVKTYSNGMYVRLAFAIAAHVDADILVIDEALAVGDAFFGQKCMRYLRAFRERGTLIFVSHDTGAVVNLCDRAILLEAGRMKAEGSAKDICDLYLESVYAEMQPVACLTTRVAESQKPEQKTFSGMGDQRLKYINASSCRNDIEVFSFNENAPSFGRGGATIVHVSLLDAETEMPLNWIVGGERVRLLIRCRTHAPLRSPIVGFSVRDRLGQVLFSDNSYLTYRENPLFFDAEVQFAAEFTFRMPILPVGDYSITAALAEGSQTDHVQHHWVHDALFFKSHTSSVCTGLVGIPMETISIEQVA
ncbi:MAG: ABC transporter ATP-binding protein [Deltaproteobacteria bacterium]|nr:ABC transporter ATP-binding protein [Deltaproteobacteria bacterium]